MPSPSDLAERELVKVLHDPSVKYGPSTLTRPLLCDMSAIFFVDEGLPRHLLLRSPPLQREREREIEREREREERARGRESEKEKEREKERERERERRRRRERERENERERERT